MVDPNGFQHLLKRTAPRQAQVAEPELIDPAVVLAEGRTFVDRCACSCRGRACMGASHGGSRRQTREPGSACDDPQSSRTWSVILDGDSGGSALVVIKVLRLWLLASRRRSPVPR